MMTVKIGNTLKALRKSYGLTQVQLAKKLNLSRVNYTRYETDASRPDYEILIAIADFYKISLDEIFDRDIK
ncbi:MAG: helix-turn-helix transcriptional regulator [Clostridiales bacterium]|nr:helix-turn-helix transcriptional regulator [Clostridiales bacterium]